MQFEGSEKKLEVVFSSAVGDLRAKENVFWQELVAKAKAKIISQMNSDYCDAYLLSESSLFVWQDRLTLITCGQTALVDAAKFILNRMGSDNIESFIFERKNEYFPEHQPTYFAQDTKELNRLIPGKSLRFGNADEHHLFLYHMDKAYKPKNKDSTLEVLMYDLDSSVLELFQNGKLSPEEIREQSGVANILPGFTVDDYVFTPYGYSLNALRGSEYFTIHVTPQEQSCYVSFETNANVESEYQEVLHSVLEVFRPKSFDTIYFNPSEYVLVEVPSFEQKSFVHGGESCGYRVTYSHFFQKQTVVQTPVILEEF